jgi:hypothetical protein
MALLGEPVSERLLYPRKEAAYKLGISLRSLDYLIAGQRIRTQRISKRVLIHARELERFARMNHYAGLIAAD